MGIVNFGIPKKQTEFLRKNMKLDTFVEGGTFKGGTAQDMSKLFNKVYTIEKSEYMFNIANKNLKNIKNITMLKGDTREYLDSILKENDNILFWLDAHWSGGKTYGEEDECPLIEELNIIFKYHKNYVILIDDARLFLAPPPLPHKIKNWPSITEILKVIPEDYELLEFEDVIYIFSTKFKKSYTNFMQEIITNKWIKGTDSFIKGLKISIKGLLKGRML
jgi:hypothetical protein